MIGSSRENIIYRTGNKFSIRDFLYLFYTHASSDIYPVLYYKFTYCSSITHPFIYNIYRETPSYSPHLYTEYKFINRHDI